ncbi:lactonase family protein [Mucilaginibacter gotjawali]|uniref:6-phosphogluconolactonase n=2 Tax=Mucilaginibacter gotjawali TaxID=1550579 RepID=A0A125T1Y9_9SPHI|nr:lactonase family protein [Mucilaginibacter gotjawali]MBB3058109.1 6-phosphogluconolactonase [Mucilaginibacter gotjawali]BAU52084.1 6-phosphogluconolactonase [Mucilaginibacter gotjawali]
MMRKLLLIISLICPVFTYAQHKKTNPTTFDLLIGTYTKGKSKGIYVYRFYAEKGKLAYLNEIDDVSNPSYLTLSGDNKFVYAVNEDGKDGAVSSFTFDPKLGKLVFINKQSTSGADPCYVSVDKDQKNIFVANYSSGNLAVLPVNKDGSLAPVSQLIQDKGQGVNKDRQEGPHVHIAQLSPDEKYLLYSDLGTDKLNVMRYHASHPQPLTPADEPFVSVPGGEGPRHIVFSNDKKHVYLVTEMGSNVHVFDYDNGKLKETQSITLLRDGFKGKTAGAAIHISPDGRFLYASNRLDTNEISVYAIDPDNGKLIFSQRVTTDGKNPRDFAIDPTGKFLLVANQDSDMIFVYLIDKASGKLFRLAGGLEIGNPVCLKFAPAE